MKDGQKRVKSTRERRRGEKAEERERERLTSWKDPQTYRRTKKLGWLEAVCTNEGSSEEGQFELLDAYLLFSAPLEPEARGMELTKVHWLTDKSEIPFN